MSFVVFICNPKMVVGQELPVKFEFKCFSSYTFQKLLVLR